jgi:periplasmic glucans biosynthesis protein
MPPQPAVRCRAAASLVRAASALSVSGMQSERLFVPRPGQPRRDSTTVKQIAMTNTEFVIRTAVLIFAALGAPWWCVSAKAAGFGFNDIDRRAQALAAAPFKNGGTLPRQLQNLQYDQYRDIRYKPERFVWREGRLPFEVAFFHEGWHFDQPVRINEVSADAVREIKFDPGQFDYGANNFDARALKGLGYAGFRVHYALNSKQYEDEVLVFLGASYFRALGKGQHYGASARGLAVDTAEPSGEEFPRFVEFWLERPARDAKALTIYGLLDSRRVTGAYRFVLKPGITTVIEVKARLHLRDTVGKLGMAPLTSMFFFGENQPTDRHDYRPEVHDSDGLSIQAGSGEWLWRPLVNPKRLMVSSFNISDPGGFGLMQRDRSFASYEDLEARYGLRPSVWVEPHGKWGAGRVGLVEIPSPDETNDNIVAYWIPGDPPKLGKVYDVAYRVLWQMRAETRPPGAWVTQTRRGRGYVKKPDDSIGFMIDFEGPTLKNLPPKAKLEGIATTDGNGEILEHEAYRNEVTGGARLALRVRRIDANKPVELRAFLRNGADTLTETWTYALPPD